LGKSKCPKKGKFSMKTQTAASHSLLWYALLFAILVAGLLIALSRSAAVGPQPPAAAAVQTGSTNQPAPATL